MKISASEKRHFNQLICTHLAAPSKFSWNQLELPNSKSPRIFWTDLVCSRLVVSKMNSVPNPLVSVPILFCSLINFYTVACYITWPKFYRHIGNLARVISLVIEILEYMIGYNRWGPPNSHTFGVSDNVEKNTRDLQWASEHPDVLLANMQLLWGFRTALWDESFTKNFAFIHVKWQ